MTIDSQILATLRNADSGVSGTDLCSKLGVSRTAIWAHIEALRKLGYDIAANPHTGYRLIASPQCLISSDLMARIGKPRIIGREIRVLKSTTSTNDEVEQMARNGEPEGMVVFAESQSKGRGRLGRKWSSPCGKGLWFSILVRPRMRPSEITQLTAATATAIVRSITQETGLKPKIKWPNDVMLGGKKVSGILTELHAELDQVKYAIIGIGIDVQQSLSDFSSELRHTATSLKIESGQNIGLPSLATSLLIELDNDYARIQNHDFDKLAEEWERHCKTIGKLVAIEIGPRKIRGRAEALDPNGALLIRTEHGRLEPITGGDVRIVSH